MARRWKSGSGKIVIWNGEGDTLPFDDPLGYADRVLFSTTFNYSRIIDKRTLTVTFPKYTKTEPIEKAQDFLTVQPLFAHGKTGEPRVRANITIDGHKLSLGCHVPVQSFPGGNGYLATTAVFRVAIIGATATHVVMTDYCNLSGMDPGTVMPAISFPITVEIFNEMN